MDVTDYFRVVSVDDHVVHLEHEGFWSDEVAEQIKDTIVAQFTEAAKKAAREGPFIVLADLRQLSVLSRKGRIALSRIMHCAKKHGIYKAVEIVPNAITRLSIREAAELTGKDDFRIMTDSMEDALAIVEKLKCELRSKATATPS